jgi:hypothetical protein
MLRSPILSRARKQAVLSLFSAACWYYCVLQTAFQIVARALSPAASALKPTLVFGLPAWVEMSLDPAGRVPAPQELERNTVVLG